MRKDYRHSILTGIIIGVTAAVTMLLGAQLYFGVMVWRKHYKMEQSFKSKATSHCQEVNLTESGRQDSVEILRHKEK